MKRKATEKKADDGHENGNGGAPSDPGVDPLLDTSATAWINVLGAFFVLFNSWGIANCWGSFQSYYAINQLSFFSQSEIAWIGSLQIFFVLFPGALVGALFDRGYFRHILYTAFFLTTFGMFMTSLASNYYQFILAQGVCVGLGLGLGFIPAISCCLTYFHRRRGLAQGVVATGSSIGSVVYPILLNNLYYKVGYPWAVRIMAFIVLGTYSVALFTMKPRKVTKPPGPFLDLPAFCETRYVLFVIGLFFGFWTLYTPFYFIESFSKFHHLDANLINYLLAIINATSTFGRIIPNYLADSIGAIRVLAVATTLSGGFLFVWIGCTTEAGIIVFCLIYGFVSGGFVSLGGPALANLTPDMSKIGRRLGQAFTLISFALLTGVPVSGAVLDSSGYTACASFAGAIVLVGACFMWASCIDLRKLSVAMHIRHKKDSTNIQNAESVRSTEL